MRNIQILKDYALELKLKNCSPRTIKSVENTMKLFFRWLEEEQGISEIEDIRRVHITGYLQQKQDSGAKVGYMNGILSYMKMFFKYCQLEEWTTKNPTDRVSYLKEEKVIINTFTPQEIKRMIAVYGDDTFLQSRNKCIITMLFDTGIRCYELCSVQMKDIRDRTILIHGKNHKERLVPISPKLRKTLAKYEYRREKYLKAWYQEEYLFLSQNGKQLTIEAVEWLVKNCGKTAEVREEIRCSPHTMRHSFAQLSLKNGLDIYSLSRVLGHENISITKRYLQSMEDEDIIKTAVECSPLMNL